MIQTQEGGVFPWPLVSLVHGDRTEVTALGCKALVCTNMFSVRTGIWSVLEPTSRGSSESAWVLSTAQCSALYRVEMQLGQKPGLGGD